jgi:hypothetical protein
MFQPENRPMTEKPDYLARAQTKVTALAVKLNEVDRLRRGPLPNEKGAPLVTARPSS